MVDMECARWSAYLKEYETGQTLEQTLILIGRTILKDLDDPAHLEFFKIIHFEVAQELQPF